MILFLSSYPPRECGIATFTQDLLAAIKQQFNHTDSTFGICALEEERAEKRLYPDEVVYTLKTSSVEECKAMAETINNDDRVTMVCIQHEFGLFGPDWGKNLIPFLKNLEKSVVVVLHTVLPKPDEQLRQVMDKIALYTDRLVTMTDHSAKILQEEYNIPQGKLDVIPHGTHLTPWPNREELKAKHNLQGKLVLSTFGLLSSNKGIENAVAALEEISQQHPEVVYLILGRTHPEVVKHEGERYRIKLKDMIIKRGLQKHVRFVNRYLDLNELLEYLSLTDVYLFTSKDPHQAVSGTFTYAMSCGCAMVSTKIPMAQEMLKENMGFLVDFDSPEQIAQATKRILGDKELLYHMGRNAYHGTRNTAWPNVAVSYFNTFKEVWPENLNLDFALPQMKLDHMQRMTSDIGMYQFANIGEPDPQHGYTLDDNARALIAATNYFAQTGDKRALKLMMSYLQVVKMCQQADGSFINYLDTAGQPTAQNNEVNLEDSSMRAVWALGSLLSHYETLPSAFCNLAEQLIQGAIPHIEKVDSPRARAFAIKGLYCYNQIHELDSITNLIDKLATGLQDKFNGVADDKWQWFEPYLTYANSLLSEGILYGYLATGKPEFKDIAIRSFDFLCEFLFIDDRIKVISNQGWLVKGEEQFGYGEQPIDVCYTIVALDIFYKETKNPEYLEKMRTAFTWYLGNNHLGQVLYNGAAGSCYDGLEKDHVNQNQGAESTVCYLISRLVMEKYKNVPLTENKPIKTLAVGRGYEFTVDRESVRRPASERKQRVAK
jgi:glycosyltransferase involved in cell wall biosynthesis